MRHCCSTAHPAFVTMAATGGRQVILECDNGNNYDGRLGVRISSIFVIGLGSLLGEFYRQRLTSTTTTNSKIQALYCPSSQLERGE